MRALELRRRGQAAIVSIGCSLLTVVLAAGCGAIKPYKVDEVDYGGAQRPAAILIADPQVYARASLINDRRRESEYLQDLLTKSTTVSFTPQIVRDLKTVEALSLSLGLSAGKSISSATAATDVLSEIEVAKLRAQLAILQKQVEGIETAKPPEVTIPPLDLSTSTSLATTPTSSTTTTLVPDVSVLRAALADVQSKLAAQTTVGGPTAPSNAYSSLVDPRSEFADRQAYRRDIRAALSEAQLDDVHDVAGNALFRLQFQVTVLPPQNYARQWGAAKLSVNPPSLSSDDISSAYYQWLSYISRELNAENGADAYVQTGVSQDHNYDYDRYIVELGRKKFFDVIDLFSDERTGRYYCLEHRTAAGRQLEEVLDRRNYAHAGSLGGYSRLGTFAVPPELILLEQDCSPYPVESGTTETPAAYRREFAATFRTQLARKQLDTAKANLVLSLITAAAPLGASTTLNRSGSGDPTTDPLQYVPVIFCQAIVDPAAHSNCQQVRVRTTKKDRRFLAAGGRPDASDLHEDERVYAVRSYSVLPSELAQRLGVTTESSQSFQTALSVGAQLSAASKAALDAGYLSQSDARAQALARQPMVVGFAGTEISAAGSTSFGKGYFGWLFGPEFVIKDSRTLALRQGVRTYGVTADVSFPGWWAYVSLEAETAWVGNWAGASVTAATGAVATSSGAASTSNAGTSVVHKRVSLPVTGATYESLTNFIASQQYGPQFSQVFVSSVTPTAIPACTSSVTFQIGGANIWRADSAFLGGVRAKSVSVLPNMKGIAAEFDMAAVYGSLVNSDAQVQPVPLVIAAGHGAAAQRWVYIVGKRQASNGASTCQSPILVPTDYSWISPNIMTFTPTEVCASAKRVPLFIRGVGMADDVYVISERLEGGASNGRADRDPDTSRRLLDLKVKAGAKLAPGIEYVAVVSKEFGAIGNVPLLVKDCSKEGAGRSQAPPTKATLVSKSVRAGKDQLVELKAPIPSGYSQIVVAVRLKTEAGNAAWMESAPVTATPGEDAEVKTKFDLSEAKLKPGDKLQVLVKIRARPGVDWQSIEADKLLDVVVG